MSKLWDDLKKNMKEWGSVAVEKAEEVSKIAVAKTEELTRISKIRIDVHQLQREMAKTYEDLGRFVSRHARDGKDANFTENAEFFNFISKTEEIKASIDKKEEEIQKIKDEYSLKDSDISEVKPDESEDTTEPNTDAAEKHEE